MATLGKFGTERLRNNPRGRRRSVRTFGTHRVRSKRTSENQGREAILNSIASGRFSELSDAERKDQATSLRPFTRHEFEALLEHIEEWDAFEFDLRAADQIHWDEATRIMNRAYDAAFMLHVDMGVPRVDAIPAKWRDARHFGTR